MTRYAYLLLATVIVAACQDGTAPVAPHLGDSPPLTAAASSASGINFIAFYSTRSGNGDVFLYDMSTSSLVPLPGLNSGAREVSPSLTPDARFLAFQRTVGGPEDVFLYDRSTSSLVSLPGLNAPNGLDDANPVLSADGRLVAFTTARNGFDNWEDVFLYDRSTSTLVPLPGLNTNGLGGFHEGIPRISDDGNLIGFRSNRNDAEDVFLYDRSTSSLVPLPGLNSSAADGLGSMSGDGRFIASHSNRSGILDIYLYDRSTSSLVPLPGLHDDGIADFSPSISADGRFIAFGSSERGGVEDIFLYDRVTCSLVDLPNLNHPNFRDAVPWVAFSSFSLPSTPSQCPESNQPPTLSIDTDPIMVAEGQTAANTGTVGDPDNDAVALTASVGNVVNNNDGTWSWSFPTTDGPTESQTVGIDADDGNGGTAQTSFSLTVNNVAPTVTSVVVPIDPVAIDDQPISAIGDFTDPAGTADETYTCTVDYGEGGGPQAGTVAGTTCNGPSQTYAATGIYTVTFTVTDKDNGTGNVASETMVVIYDPSSGFVTGGGWFNSPAGAFKDDESLTGKANFGFVSKYKKGATVPTGNTEFQFKAGDLNFRSSSYEWLVVNQNGENAQFTGEGTINGGGVYKFMLWAGDKNPDTFRIRITEVGGGIVYDNGTDQEIDGGSIKIHTK